MDSSCLRMVCFPVSMRRRQLTTSQRGTTKRAERSKRVRLHQAAAQPSTRAHQPPRPQEKILKRAAKAMDIKRQAELEPLVRVDRCLNQRCPRTLLTILHYSISVQSSNS